jgi:hypothetical protein
MKPPVDRLMLGQARAEVTELRAQLAKARALLHRWIQFDFDCPEEEYDSESDCYEQDGAAEEKLREDTATLLAANPESPRAAAERAVLDACIKAMGELSDDVLRDETLPPNEPLVELARAELARRAVLDAKR